MTKKYTGKAMVPAFEAFSSKCEADQLHIFRMAKAGSSVATADGRLLAWASSGLQKSAPSFIGKRISVNHGKESFGTIVDTWYKNDTLYGKLKVSSNNIKRWLDASPDLVGNSIELSSFTANDDGEIIDAEGYGVSLAFPPHNALCDSPSCGFDAYASEIEIINSDEEDARKLNMEEKNMEELEKLKAEFSELTEKYLALEAAHAEMAGFASKLEITEAENKTLKESLGAFVAKERQAVIEGLASKFKKPDTIKEMLKDASDDEIKRFTAFASVIEGEDFSEEGAGAGDSARMNQEEVKMREAAVRKHQAELSNRLSI